MAYTSNSIRTKKKTLTLDELHLNPEVRAKLNQLLEEFTFIDALSQLDIPLDNKILLHGHTGCGKTATAHALGNALHKKVITINLSGFVSSKLGETAKNLSDLFKEATVEKAILFIDEFDFVGKLRDYDEKDSGEMKRLVNALIQQIDHLDDETILICATNHISIIDTAILRRFQIKLNYELPDQKNLDNYYDDLLAKFPKEINQITRSYGISYAEAKDLVNQQIKVNAIQHEKQRTHILFDYDNAKDETLESSTTQTESDFLKGYSLKNAELSESANSSNSNQTRCKAIKTFKEADILKGKLTPLTGRELMGLDTQKSPHCQRVKAITQKGIEVWLYLAKNS